MSRSSKRPHGRVRRPSGDDSSTRAERRGRIGARKRGGGRDGTRSWIAGKRPVLRFVVVLGLLICVFEVCFYLWITKGSLFLSYLNLNARATAAILNVFGAQATTADRSIVSPDFSLSIEAGCDAIQSSAFFVFVVLASPVSVPLRRRIPFVLAGTLFLLTVNLIRIVSLFYTGVYFPSAFEMMHLEVWQAGFIFLPLVMWILWATRVRRYSYGSADVSS